MVEWPDLKNPRPRSEPKPYEPVVWPATQFVPLPEGLIQDTPPFAEVAEARRTRYSFTPLSDGQLSALMQLTCRVTATLAGPLAFAQSHRPAPSAGAVHPVHVVMHRPGDAALCRYDPYGHGLSQLDTFLEPSDLRAAMHEVIDAPAGTLLLFVAEPGLTASKYKDAASLVWRDAGVLLGTFAMAAEALSLNFSPMGVTGEPWASQLIPGAPLVGVGAAFLGARL